MRQGQFRQAEGADALHTLLYFFCHRPDLADQSTLAFLDAASQQLHEVWHIGVCIRQRTLVRHRKVQERADALCHTLDRIADPAHTLLDASCNTANDILAPADCRGSYILDTAPDGRCHVTDGRSRIGNTVLNGVYSIREYRSDLVPDIRDSFPESIAVFPESGQSKTDAANGRHCDTCRARQTSKCCACGCEETTCGACYACKSRTRTCRQTRYGRTDRTEQTRKCCPDCTGNTAQRRTDRRYDTGKTAA